MRVKRTKKRPLAQLRGEESEEENDDSVDDGKESEEENGGLVTEVQRVRKSTMA